MYTEGIKVGNNSYVLSDEYGLLTILKSSNNQEQVEEYIKLKNLYEEERDEYSNLQNNKLEIDENEKFSKKFNIEVIPALFLAEGVIICALLLGKFELFAIVKLISFSTVIAVAAGVGLKILSFGTKKKRSKQREEINAKLIEQNDKLKELEKQINMLKKNVEEEAYFREDEIVPVTTVENKKANVKMRVLKLDQSR